MFNAARITTLTFAALLILWLGFAFVELLSLLNGPLGTTRGGARTVTAIVTASDGGAMRVDDGGVVPSGPIEVRFPLTARPTFIALLIIPFGIVGALALVGAWSIPHWFRRRKSSA